MNKALLQKIDLPPERLADSFREAYDHIPWADAAGMRDRLIHGYDAVDLDIVWQAVTREVPSFLQ